MRNKKILIIGIAVFAVFFLMIILFGGSGSSNNMVEDEKYVALISGVEAKSNEEIYNYELKLLTDDIQFNSQITSAPYEKITFKNVDNFKSLGFVFLTQTSNDCTLKFTLYKNDEELKSTTKNFKSGELQDIELLLENSVEVTTNDTLYIEVEESVGNEKTSFVFDTLLAFFDKE